MLQSQLEVVPLAERIKSRIREATYDRIRNLEVRESEGQLIVQGQVGSHHVRQLALQGALEFLSGDQFSARITVD